MDVVVDAWWRMHDPVTRILPDFVWRPTSASGPACTISSAVFVSEDHGCEGSGCC